MSDFRVLSEVTFNFRGDKLYLMLLRDSNKYGVEVVDRDKTFGRKFARDRSNAEYVYNTISKRIDRCKSIEEANNIITKAFSRRSLTETVLLFMVDEKVLSQNKVGEIIFDLNLNVAKSTNDFFLNKTKKGYLTIFIRIKSDKAVFGCFAGKRFGKNFKFHLL